MWPEDRFKIIIVGDPMVGKSSLCKSYVNKAPYKKPYQPTISETHEVSVLLGKKEYPIILWEPSSVEEWKQLRIQDYSDADCFLLCYSVDNHTSFSNIQSKWLPELKLHCPWVPVVLVGTKKDLRTPSNFLIRPEEGTQLKDRVKAQGQIECSTFSLSSIEGVLILALSTVLETRKLKKSSNCREKPGSLVNNSRSQPRKGRFCDIL